jgi:early secretory antigenic target protein ESAT-6
MTENIMVVNFMAMEQASQSIQSALGTMTARLDEIDSMGKRLSASWTGEAQQAYHVRQLAWQRAAGDLSSMLKDIQVALVDSMHRYQDTEKKNASYFPVQG